MISNRRLRRLAEDSYNLGLNNGSHSTLLEYVRLATKINNARIAHYGVIQWKQKKKKMVVR